MNTHGQTSKEYLNYLQLIHGAMLIGQVLFAGVAIFLTSEGGLGQSEGDLNDIFKLLAPVLVLGGIAGSIFLPKTLLASAKESSDLRGKLQTYRSTSIIKFAVLEAPSLVSLVAFLLTGNYFFLGLAAIIVAVFFMNRPTTSTIINELELNQDEARLVENEAAIIL
ncbi:MAG: hypothetical protein AAFR66_07850 [Bacteroidota bacterium]